MIIRKLVLLIFLFPVFALAETTSTLTIYAPDYFISEWGPGPKIKEAFEKVIKLYSTDFPLFSVQRTTDFRINRYNEGGFMSSHVDNIHHSHGQQYGYPQVTALLYLNDNYEGGVFKVAGKTIYPEKGSAVIFPSNFMFPHQAGVVTKGTRWSIVSWLM